MKAEGHLLELERILAPDRLVSVRGEKPESNGRTLRNEKFAGLVAICISDRMGKRKHGILERPVNAWQRNSALEERTCAVRITVVAYSRKRVATGAWLRICMCQCEVLEKRGENSQPKSLAANRVEVC